VVGLLKPPLAVGDEKATVLLLADTVARAARSRVMVLVRVR
jgi:hypothetical protein